MFAVRYISLILILILEDEIKQKFKGKINIQKQRPIIYIM